MRRERETVALRRVWACLLSAVLWAGCAQGDETPTANSSSSPPATVTIDGNALDVNELVAGLCLARLQASTDPGAAEATYNQRSRNGVAIVASALKGSNSILASSLAEAAAGVEADLGTDPPRPTLDLNLGRLTEMTREGLARLAIRTSACEK